MSNLIEANNRNAVIYCRVSDKVQVWGSSLAFQEEACREYARQHHYEVVQIFIEKGESARTDDRTELIRLISFCKQKSNHVKAVIFHKVDRWARQSLDYQQLKKDLKACNIAILSATEPLEDTPAGRFMENMLASQAQFDNEVRIERCKNGMRDAVNEGRWVWTAPIGYSNIKIGRKTNLVPNDKAVIVRKAFEEIARNAMPTELVRQQLLKEGLTTKAGKLMSKAGFYRMLRNEIYTGWIVVFGERYKGAFEAIIAEKLYQQVQRILNRSKSLKLIYKKDRDEFPLRRFIHQPSGLALSGFYSVGRNKSYLYYYLRNPIRCFSISSIEDAFRRLLCNFELSETNFDRLRDKVKKKLIEKYAEADKLRKDAEKQIQNLKVKQHTLVQKNMEGVISNEILKSQLNYIEDELVNLQAIELVKKPEKADFDALLDIVSRYLINPFETWKNAPLDVKLRLQWFSFPKGLVFDGEILQTTEICSLFKAKNGNFEALSHVVYHPNKNTNQIRKEPCVSKTDLPVKASGKIDDTVYWQSVGNELIQLADIIKDIP